MGNAAYSNQGNVNSVRVPVNNTAGAGINTGQWYCTSFMPIDFMVLEMCGKAWSIGGKEYAALAIKAPPATGPGGFIIHDPFNPVSNPNITVFKAKEARKTLPIQLNSTRPYVISQMVNPGNVFDSKTAKKATTGAVLMDKANPVGIFYIEPFNDADKDNNKRVQTSDKEIFQNSPTYAPAEYPTYSPTTADYEPDARGQFMYADYIAYYFDGHGRVTIGVTGTVGNTEFF